MAEEAKEIARSASAKACQVEAIIDENESERTTLLPGDVEPSTSPLDFFANCRQHKAKQRFVDERGEQNTYRAILVTKRWDEFATKRTTGDGNHQIMAHELDLSPLEAEIILQALEPVVLRHRNDE